MIKKYTEEHDWILIEADIATVGITDYAQEQLGDLVFVELPEVENTFSQGDSICVVESVKTAYEIYSPISGIIVETNQELQSSPELINSDPEGKGWLFKMQITEPTELQELLTPSEYQQII